MNTPVLKILIKLCVMLLLGLLPAYTLLAQQNQKKESSTIRVKMFKSVDGKLLYSKDTVLQGIDPARHLEVLQNLKADTAAWKKLSELHVEADSLYKVTLKDLPMAISIFGAQDTAAGRKQLKAYRLQRATGNKENAILFERVQNVSGDSVLVKELKNIRFKTLHGDSLRQVEVKVLRPKEGAARAFTIVRVGTDSARTLVDLTTPEGVFFKNGTAIVGGNDITARYTTSDKLKIETDESGKTTIYEVDKKGNKKEIDAYYFGKTGEKPTVVLLNRTRVENITKEDKRTLKGAGAKVEKSEKKELKIEDLSYYPNPSNGRFNVSFTLPEEGPAIVRVLNSAGKEVYSEDVSRASRQFEKRLDLTGFGKGIFYLQVEQNGRTLTKRLLVQ